MAENKRTAKLDGASRIVAGQRSWQGATKKKSGEQATKTIKRAKHS